MVCISQTLKSDSKKESEVKVRFYFFLFHLIGFYSSVVDRVWFIFNILKKNTYWL